MASENGHAASPIRSFIERIGMGGRFDALIARVGRGKTGDASFSSGDLARFNGGGGANGGSGDGSGGGGDGEGGGGGDGGDEDNRVLYLSDLQAFMKEKGVQLPADMLQVAKDFGLRQSVLTAYMAAQSAFFTGFFVRNVPFFRDRILVDPLFFFKVGVEIVIDSACTTIAEVRKRGPDFWHEFEFYLSDLMVGLTLDVVLVGLMAPAAILGAVSKEQQAKGGIQKLLANVPSAVFAPSLPGAARYTLGQRLSCLVVKFLEYSLAGIVCGLIGQGIANAAMAANRPSNGIEDPNAVAIPPLGKTALVWGLFMGVSSNLRYQAVYGIERLVDLTIAKKVPPIAYATTIGVRFYNNVFGGENFIDLARWAGVQ